jgi:hypothetical protein
MSTYRVTVAVCQEHLHAGGVREGGGGAVSRKREPVAEVGAEDYLIVKHTHDVEAARRLMAAALADENGCPAWDDWPHRQQHTCTEECMNAAMKQWERRLAKPEQVWVRFHGALPNSYAAYEGWSGCYCPAEPNSRGAFRAVEFR